MHLSDPVRIRDASISLGGRPVVREVDLSVGPGEFVALLGTNGSGKSTLMRAAVGLLPLDGGSVELFGTSVRRFRDWSRVGYVPQRSTATSGVPSTVREVVMSGRLARRRLVGLPSRADRRSVDAVLDQVGLADRRDDPAAELSGGQQQRVLIARGLAGDCDLLVMDEPMAGVDHDSQHVLAPVFAALAAEGRSLWMIAHELGPFEPLIDRAVVLRDGVVEHDGPAGYASHDLHDPHHGHDPAATARTGLDGSGAWR